MVVAGRVSQIPNLIDINRITTITDPVIRNLQITQCYFEQSAIFSQKISSGANWCTFATWASKQAGQTIRKEDLKRMLEIRLSSAAAQMQVEGGALASVEGLDRQQAARLQSQAFDPKNFTAAIDRASQAVARGNLKVFAEIGREFNRFITSCLQDVSADNENLSRFRESLRPGDPPDGQGYLRLAFSHYYTSLFEPDPKIRAELVLLANIEIGYHEQTRLQPEIAEALDAGLVSTIDFTHRLLASLFPNRGWLALAQSYLRRMVGRPSGLDKALDELLAAVRLFLRETITELMMTIWFPCDVRLRLGQDLKIGFPASLQHLSNPDLVDLLEKIDPTVDSLSGSGARDWANLPDRLHFIVDLFRCYQEDRDLFDPPFTAEQVITFKAGKLPEGEL